MALQGCISVTFAPSLNAYGLLEITRVLQDVIKLVPLDHQNMPIWYKERINPENKVPALEHNNQVIVESLDLLKYLDNNFEGPKISHTDPAKVEFGEKLLSYMNKTVFNSLTKDPTKDAGTSLDYLENALSIFDDGPFFLGQFSLVDIAYIPFIERFHLSLQNVWNYDLTLGRPRLTAWFEKMNKIDAYTQTKHDPEKLIAYYKSLFGPATVINYDRRLKQCITING